MVAVLMRNNLAPKIIVNPSIVKPPIQANNFEVKGTLLQLVQGNQFGGGATENPNEHINDFLDSCEMYKANGVSDDAIRLRLFPYSLRGSAKEWLKSCAPDSLRTWIDVSKAFLNKYFPPQRTAKIKTWERYKALQILCPHHGIGDDELINNFYEGLNNVMKMNLDSGSGQGALDKIDHKTAKELIEEIASRTFHWNNDRHKRKGKASVESANNLEVKGLVEELKQQVALLKSSNTPNNSSSSRYQVSGCEFCGDQGHPPNECPLMVGDVNGMVQGMNVTIPFLDMVTKIPNYRRFLKELVTMKRRSGGVQSVNLSRECSAILTQKLPCKLEDPGSFSIPCSIQGVKITRALCDLGASVSLMPLSLFKKLQLEDLKPSRISLQLADRSVKYPLGVIEDVPLKVGKLVIPCDFFVMDMPEDRHVPIILGRPCLATGGAMIDHKSGKLSLQVGNEKIEFELNNSMKSPPMGNSCCRVDMVEDNLDKPILEPSFLDLLEACSTNENRNGRDLVLRVDVKGDLGEDESREEEFEDQINDEIELYLSSPNLFDLSSFEGTPWLDNSSSDWEAQINALEATLNGNGSVQKEGEENWDMNDSIMNLNVEKLTPPSTIPYRFPCLDHEEIFQTRVSQLRFDVKDHQTK
ncbi:uncharacterized protein LOC141629277 [Silene latifolia]|uniref:uncharacterized protein LOC141629277 n=1 Tax=Silene latifolia TaxID=37657 RepID=UPI003D76BA20